MLLAYAAPAPCPLELLQLDDELGFDDVLRHMQSRSPGGPLLGRSPGGAGAGHQTARSRGSSMRGAAARGEKLNGGGSGSGTGSGGTPGGVGDVAVEAAAERGEGSSTGGGGGAAQYKRSSTTGASAEWPHGLSKVVKEETDNSPRQQSSRGGGGGGRARSHAAAEPRGSRSDRGSGGKTKKAGRSPAVEEEEETDLEDFDEYAVDESGRPRSAPASASHGGGSSRRAAPVPAAGAGGFKGDRRLSFTAAATPAAKSEVGARPPRASLEPLTTPRHSLALGSLCGRG